MWHRSAGSVRSALSVSTAAMLIAMAVFLPVQSLAQAAAAGDAAFVVPHTCFGLASETEMPGGISGSVWRDHTETDVIKCKFDAADLSVFDTLTFTIDSAVANGAGLVLVLRSENPNSDGQDYYFMRLTVDWTGPKRFEIDRAALGVARSPVGWHQIEALEVWAEGWGNQPKPDTSLVVSDFVFSRKGTGTADMPPGLSNGVFTVSPACFGLESVDMPDSPGTEGALWKDHPQVKTIRCSLGSADLTDYDTVTFTVYSLKANQAPITFILRSTNPNVDGANYYRSPTFAVDWEGPRTFTFRLRDLTGVREPLGWHAIDAIEFWSDGWGAIPQPDTQLILSEFVFRAQTYETGDWRAALHDKNVGSVSIPPTCFGLQPAPVAGEGRGETVVWRDHPATDHIVCSLGTADLTRFDTLSFSMYSERANYAGLTLLLRSENPNSDGLDYYSVPMTVDWTGWKQFTLPLRSFRVSRQPRGWDQIDTIEIWAEGWGNVPQPDTVLYLSEMKLTGSTATSEGGRKTVGIDLANLPAHPRIFVSDADFARIKERVETDEVARRWFAMIRAQADRLLGADPVPYAKVDKRLSSSGQVLNRIYPLALAYKLTGEAKYAEQAWVELENAAGYPDWNADHFLDASGMTHAFAIGYDWLYDYWTEEQRTVLREAIIKHGLEAALEGYRGDYKGGYLGDRHGWVNRSDNWNIVSNGGIGLGAMAIADEEPVIAEEVLKAGLASIPKALAEFGPDGGYEEGISYWNYAMQYMAVYIAGLDATFGSDFGLSAIDGLAEAARFPVYGTGPTGLTFNYGDASGRTNPFMMFWLAKKYDEPNYATWRLDTIQDVHVWDLIWYSLLDPAFLERSDYKDLPLDAYFRKAEVVTFRSAWDDPDAVFIAMKAGDNKAPHGDLDLGSFVLDALGVRWAEDLGSEDYNVPGYWNRGVGGERWTYYRKRAEGQNVLVINPGPEAEQHPLASTVITHFSSSAGEAVAVTDLTAAYIPFAESVRRGIALMDERRQVILQDEVELNEPGEIYWFMHTRSQVELNGDGRSAVLTQGNKRLQALILEPEDAAFRVMPAEPLPTSPPRPEQTPNSGVQKLAIHLEDVREVRIVVLFTPLDDGGFSAVQPRVLPLDEWVDVTKDGGTLWGSLPRMGLTILEPRPGEVLQGDAAFKGALHGVSEEDIARVQVLLNGEPIYDGDTFPQDLVIDTLTLEDGRYDLAVVAMTRLGGVASETRSFRVDNWWEIHHDMRPPVTSSWFAFADPSRTSDESDGWAWVSGDAGMFFGDEHRRVVTGSGDEYMTWETPSLRRYEVVLYVQDAPYDGLGVAVSVEDEHSVWHKLEPAAVWDDASPAGWRRVRLTGEIPADIETTRFQLTVSGLDHAGRLHVGDVLLVGLQ